ncbi:MAG: aminopeptidase P N-terminal domain-containing protein [Planctomycetota bacterium]
MNPIVTRAAPKEREVEAFRARRQRVLDALLAQNGEGILVLPTGSEIPSHGDGSFPFRPGSDFDYLCGFPEPDAILVVFPETRRSRTTARAELFVRPKDKTAEVWHGRRFGEKAARRAFGVDEAKTLAQFDERLLELLDDFDRLFVRYRADQRFDDRLFRLFGQRSKRHRRRSIAAHPALIDPTPAIARERLVKDEVELDALRLAAEVSCAGHRAAMAEAAPGHYEFEIQAALESEFRRRGSSRNGYESIVASGANACILHYVENRRRTKSGDLVLLDAGAEVGGLTADITRTWPVTGSFTDAQLSVYKAVLKAQRAAIRAVRPGRSYAQVHATAARALTRGLVDLGVLRGDPKKLFKTNAFRPFYMHGTGHYLGRDVHDVGAYEDEKGRPIPLEPGMVLTIEPGLYFDSKDQGVPAQLRGIGVRIEDDILVTEDGCEVLTAAVPTDPKAIEAVCRGE